MNPRRFKNTMSIKYGCTGFVELKDFAAIKYSLFNDGYWLREYATLLCIWKNKMENVITHESCAFIKKTNPGTGLSDFYFEMVFDRYIETLYDYKVYRDSTVVQMFLDLLSAVSMLHRCGIWHRDIKPGNIMTYMDKRDSSIRAMLIDFSHAYKIRTYVDRLDAGVVTYPYRAPEVFIYDDNHKSRYNEKIDVWAIGMVMIQVITGKTFHDSIIPNCDESDWKGFILGDYMPAIEKEYMYNKRTFHYAKTYWSWIKKMINKDPEQRISAQDMYNEVLEFSRKNNMKNTIPVNVEPPKDEKIDKSTSIDVIENQALLDKIKDYTGYTISEWNFVTKTDLHAAIMKYFVTGGLCTINNYKSIVVAVWIITDSVYYDNIINIRELIERINMSMKDVLGAMIQIIQRYDKELFMYDTFLLDNANT